MDNDALCEALRKSNVALQEARAATHAAVRQHVVKADEAGRGLVDFLDHDVQAPLLVVENECAALRASLPASASHDVGPRLDAMRVQIVQLRALIEIILASTRQSREWPF